MTPKQKAEQIYDQYWSAVNLCNQDELPDFRPLIEKAIIAAEKAKAKEERAACAQIAETIRKRELAIYTGANCPYDTIAEEIRDRIQMRPATSNDDWPELGSADDRFAIRNLSRS